MARKLLRRLAARPELRLAYVSGRDKKLVEEAMEEYELPEPDFVIGDVGTTLYRVQEGEWSLDASWQEVIGRDWNGLSGDDIVSLLAGQDGLQLELQPTHKQNRYKVSYYSDPDCDGKQLQKRVEVLLAQEEIHATVIWSRDEAKDRGLLDILPKRANKLQAIRFLIESEGIHRDRVVFAGDSGNDLDVLTSELRAILVRNGGDDVRQEALAAVQETGQSGRLYLARGGNWGLNGNYSAGVIEGLAHFFPETVEWVAAAKTEIGSS